MNKNKRALYQVLPISMATGLAFNYLFLFLEQQVIAAIAYTQNGDSSSLLFVLLIAALFVYALMTLSILGGCFLIWCAFRYLKVPNFNSIVITASVLLLFVWFVLIKSRIVEGNTSLLLSIISFAAVYEVLFYFYNRKSFPTR